MELQRWLPGVLLALLSVCSASGSAAPPTAARAMAAFEAVIGDARCTNDSQCRSVAVGHRACGGPELYLAWSTQRSSAQAIERAVVDFNAASRQALPGQSVSTCFFLHDPGAYCVRTSLRTASEASTGHPPGAASAAGTAEAAGRCQLRPAAAPPAGGLPPLSPR